MDKAILNNYAKDLKNASASLSSDHSILTSYDFDQFNKLDLINHIKQLTEICESVRSDFINNCKCKSKDDEDFDEDYDEAFENDDFYDIYSKAYSFYEEEDYISILEDLTEDNLKEELSELFRTSKGLPPKPGSPKYPDFDEDGSVFVELFDRDDPKLVDKILEDYLTSSEIIKDIIKDLGVLIDCLDSFIKKHNL